MPTKFGDRCEGKVSTEGAGPSLTLRVTGEEIQARGRTFPTVDLIDSDGRSLGPDAVTWMTPDYEE